MDYNNEVELNLKHWIGTVFLHFKKVLLVVLCGLLLGLGSSFKKLPTHEGNLKKATKDLKDVEIQTVDTYYEQYLAKVDAFERTSKEAQDSYVMTLDDKQVPSFVTRYALDVPNADALAFLSQLRLSDQDRELIDEAVGFKVNRNEFSLLFDMYLYGLNNNNNNNGIRVTADSSFKEILVIDVEGFDQETSTKVRDVMLASVNRQLEHFKVFDHESQITLQQMEEIFVVGESSSVLSMQNSYKEQVENSYSSMMHMQEAPSTYSGDQKYYYELLVKNGTEIKRVSRFRHVKGAIKGGIVGGVLAVVYSLLAYAMHGVVRCAGMNRGQSAQWLTTFYFDKSKKNLFTKLGKKLVVQEDLDNACKMEMLVAKLAKVLELEQTKEIFVACTNETEHSKSVLADFEKAMKAKGVSVVSGNPVLDVKAYEAFVDASSVMYLVVCNETKFKDLISMSQTANTFNVKQLGAVTIEEL